MILSSTQLNSVLTKVRKLKVLDKYFVRNIDKEAWRSALPDLANDPKFEQFLDDYLLGFDIGVKNHLPTARATSRPPLDDYSTFKFAQRIIKWHENGHTLGPFPPDHPAVADARETPIFTVDRADGGKRPVSDASKRLNDGGPSVNDEIKSNKLFSAH